MRLSAGTPLAIVGHEEVEEHPLRAVLVAPQAP
jgi:hypothetical protein